MSDPLKAFRPKNGGERRERLDQRITDAVNRAEQAGFERGVQAAEAEVGIDLAAMQDRWYEAGVQAERARVLAKMDELHADETQGWVSLWSRLEEFLEATDAD